MWIALVQADDLFEVESHNEQSAAPVAVGLLRGLRKEACRAFARNGQQLICCTPSGVAATALNSAGMTDTRTGSSPGTQIRTLSTQARAYL